MRTAAACLSGLVLALSVIGCGSEAEPSGAADRPSTTASATSTTDATDATDATGATEATDAVTVAEDLRTKRYCEVLLVEVADGGGATAEVFNTYGLNECPPEQWAQLDTGAIASAEGATLAMLNGPRYWLMDRIEKQGGRDDLARSTFGELEMNRLASVEIPSLADAGKPYTPAAVDRRTVFTFDAGQTVYQLTDPDGSTYTMQSWSQQKDPDLAEADLADLGSRLELPAGWTFAARTLDAPLEVVTTDRPAEVVQDELGNSYSR